MKTTLQIFARAADQTIPFLFRVLETPDEGPAKETAKGLADQTGIRALNSAFVFSGHEVEFFKDNAPE